MTYPQWARPSPLPSVFGSLLVFPPLCPMHLLPLLLLFLPRFGIDFSPQEFLFAQEFSPVFESRRTQCSLTHCRQHRASWLLFMTAISEPALFRQRINIRKCLSNTIFCVPQLHLTQARRVNQ